jgi:hypothetical protein
MSKVMSREWRMEMAAAAMYGESMSARPKTSNLHD